MRVVICALIFASPFAYADKQKTESKRADVPWVSLAHQRKLREDAQKRPANVSKDSKKSVQARPTLEADKFEYATDGSGTMIARGKAKIVSSEFDISADKATYSQKLNAARVIDNVCMSSEDFRAITTAADVAVDGKKIKTEYVRAGSVPMFLEAESLTGGEEKYTLTNSKVYLNEPATGSLSAKATKTTYDKKTNMIRMEDVYFNIDSLPIMHFSDFEISADTVFPFDLETRVANNGDYGFYLRNTVHYTGFEKTHGFAPGMLLDVYTKRSVLFGPAFRYDKVSADNVMKGFIQTGFIHDTGSSSELGFNSYGERIDDRNRYFLEMRHNQIYDDRFGLTAVVSAWSDEFVTRDFRPDFFYQNQTPDNFVEAIYYGDMWTSSLFTRFAPNDWELVQQRLPEARIDVQPVEVLQTGAYVRSFASVAYLYQTNDYPLFYNSAPAHSISTTRFDGYVGIDRPIQISDWAKITPVAGARLTSYSDTVGNESAYTRALGQVGFDAQMDIWGQFDYQSKTMGIDGVRHHIIPMISYRYIPEAERGRNRIEGIDIDYMPTYPPILDLGSIRNIDDMTELNTMRFGLQNVFETRDAEYGSRELARFDVFQDVHFTRHEPALRYKYWDDDNQYKQDYSDVYVNASVSPARWLTVGTFSRFSWEHSCTPEVNTYITLRERDIAEFSVGTIYLRDMCEQYYASVSYSLSQRYSLIASWHYDADTSTLVYQRYGLRTRIGNAWLIDYVISNRSGSTRENNTSVGINIRILGL